MHQKIVTVSEALGSARPSLIPALAGCPDCGAVRMIAAPAIGTCTGCGVDLAVLETLPAQPVRMPRVLV